MMDFLRKHMRTIFLITIVGFLAGAFIGFGGYFFGTKTPQDAVIEVNGSKVPYKRFLTMLNQTIDQMHKSKEQITDAMLKQKKQEIIQDLLQEEVFSQEAKKYGITVSDGELAADLQRYPAFQVDGRFDQRAYFEVIYRIMRTTPKEFEESRRKQIAIAKLRHLIASNVKITEPELQLEWASKNRGNMDNYPKERGKFLEQVRQEKTMMVFSEWFKLLNQQLKVKIYLDEIEKGA
ncbi:MAG: SurA N-terminal domain-containing protein [Endomicrobiales bacterium]|nr:SurA N-terminal domain-containing protein [Endomicrobiales bacterium]